MSALQSKMLDEAARTQEKYETELTSLRSRCAVLQTQAAEAAARAQQEGAIAAEERTRLAEGSRTVSSLQVCQLILLFLVMVTFRL